MFCNKEQLRFSSNITMGRSRRSRGLPPPPSVAATDDVQIPGFAYDAERRRYFRLPLSSDVLGLMPLAVINELSSASKTTSKSTKRCGIVECGRRSSLCRAIQQRELSGPSATFYGVGSQHELRRLVPSDAFPLAPLEDDADCLQLVGGGPNNTGVAAIVKSGRRQSSRTALITFKLAKVDTRSTYEITNYKYSVKENLCSEVSEIGLMSTYKRGDDFASRIPQAYTASCRRRLDRPNRGNRVLGLSEEYLVELYNIDGRNRRITLATEINGTVFSIGFDESAELMAIGKEGSVDIVRVRDDDRLANVQLQAENAHSVCFVDSGRGLLTGGHRGGLYHFDRRSPPNCGALKVDTGRHLLCHLKPCCDDRTIVCSGYGDYLATVDLRARRQVIQFDEHVNRGRKIRTSVDGNVVSCTGYDGRTRIWNLSTGGKPVVTFDPPPGYVSHRPVHSVFTRPWCEEAALVVAYANSLLVYNA